MIGSWMTTAAGYAVVLISVVQQAFSESPVPSTAYEWITFTGKIITGVGIALAKDFNKSNAPNPITEAKPVA